MKRNRISGCLLLAGWLGFWGLGLGPVSACGEKDAQPSGDGGSLDTSAWDGARRDAAAQGDSGQVSDAGMGDASSPDAGEDGAAPQRVLGVTLTDPWAAEGSGASHLLDKLSGLTGSFGPPTVRVVFDENMDRAKGGGAAADYEPAVVALRSRAVIMGELLDSFYVQDYSVAQMRERACEYRSSLGHLVDIWEVGNEINGEWVGDAATDKLRAVLEVFGSGPQAFSDTCPGWTLPPDELPFALALTLYYNGPRNGGIASSENCWEDPDHAMLFWARQTFGSGGELADHTNDFEFILVSYYEDDCDGLQPSWAPVFDELGLLFPHARLGFGECGTQFADRKVAYAERYYRGMDSPDPVLANMRVGHPRYVGGFFWWYFSDDMDRADFYSVLQAALGDSFWQVP